MRVFLCVLRVLCGESVFSVPRTNLPCANQAILHKKVAGETANRSAKARI